MLVLDNLAVHKIGGLREWLAEHGVQVLFLPPYSPNFSPIERAWSKLKTAVARPKPKIERRWKQPFRQLSTRLVARVLNTGLTTVATTYNPLKIG